MIHERLDELSGRIYEIILTKPFNAESYSEIFTDMTLTFIDLRLDSILAKLNIKNNILHNKQIISYFSEINELLNYEYCRVFELFFLLPQLKFEMEWCDAEQIFDIKDILEELQLEYGIKIEESKLEEHWNARHNIQLPKEILQKYQLLYSYYLTFPKLSNIELLSSNKDLPFHHIIKTSSLFSKKFKKPTWENLIYKMEWRVIFELKPNHLKPNVNNFIHSIYKFKDKNAEIENLIRFIKYNDIWDLSRIHSNFEIINKSTRDIYMITTRISELLSVMKKQPSILKEYIVQPKYADDTFMSMGKYFKEDNELSEIRVKISNNYYNWINNPKVSEWDKYWKNIEKEHIQNELKIAKDISFDKDKKILELRSNETIPTITNSLFNDDILETVGIIRKFLKENIKQIPEELIIHFKTDYYDSHSKDLIDYKEFALIYHANIISALAESIEINELSGTLKYLIDLFKFNSDAKKTIYSKKKINKYYQREFEEIGIEDDVVEDMDDILLDAQKVLMESYKTIAESGIQRNKKKDKTIIRQANELTELKVNIINKESKTDYIPEFAKIQNLKPGDITISIDFYNQGKELIINVGKIDVKGGFGLLDFYDKRNGKPNLNYVFLTSLIEGQWDEIIRAKFKSVEKNGAIITIIEPVITSRTREFNNLFKRKFPIGDQKVINKAQNKFPEPLFTLTLSEPE